MSKSIKGTTISGFSFEISSERLSNYELVEAIAEVDTNPLVLPKLLKLLLGDQADALKEHVRDENGLVPMDKMGEAIKEIFEAQNKVKKLPSSPK